jgi:uncharacterized membrane protein YdbT with pleckstrin-like domain
MSYIQQSLGQGERIIALAHFHWWYTVFSYLLVLVPLALLIAVLIVFPDATRTPFAIGAFVLLALGIVYFFTRMVRKWTTEIGVTSHRFVKKTGLFSLHTDEFALNNVEGVRVNQTFWGKIWGYGHLRIEGTGDDSFVIPDIADPIGFRRAIETAKGIKE